jgi:hypothetical protein
MPTASKATQLSRIKSLSTSMPKYCAAMTFTVDGTTYTTPQVVQIADALLAADAATVQAKVSYESAEAAEKKLFSADAGILAGVRENLEVAFSSSPATLADLGVVPRKARKPLSPEALVAKAAKARATRGARGTTSKKQKATVHGNVSGVEITPIVTGSAAPATTASPPVAAPSAPSVTPVVTGTAAGSTSHS